MNWQRKIFEIELHAMGKCDPETCPEPGHEDD